MPKRPTEPRILARARKLRSDMTGPERALWSILRSRQLAHLKFRRQHAIGPYVVDFYCHSARLAIEIDGMSHDDTAAVDTQRTAYLQRIGVRVLRVLNDEVMSDRDAVAEWIANEAAKFVMTGQNGAALTPALSRREREQEADADEHGRSVGRPSALTPALSRRERE